MLILHGNHVITIILYGTTNRLIEYSPILNQTHKIGKKINSIFNGKTSLIIKKKQAYSSHL